MSFTFRSSRLYPVTFLATASALLLCAVIWPGRADAQKPRKALERDQVIELLESGVAPTRVAELARDYGIAFEISEQVETQLRDAGATDELLATLRELAPHLAAPSASGTGAAVLLIEATPGGAQAYIDDEPVGTTSQQGRLRLSKLSPGAHRVRLSLRGFRDYEQSVQLVPGQTVTVAANLQSSSGASSSPNPLAAPASTASQSPPAMGSAGGSPNPLAGAQPAMANVARFSVAHDHGGGGANYCMGELLVGNGRIAFRSVNGDHSFDFPLSELKEAKKNSVYLSMLGGFHIRFKKEGNFNFVSLNAAGQPQPPDDLLTTIAHAAGGQ
jgi:hypothetical protein